MRNYVKGIYGIFHEDNNGLGIHLTLKVWRATQEEFDAVIVQLRQDVANAGAGWTGTLSQESEMWFGLADDFVQNMLEINWHGTSQPASSFETLMQGALIDQSPRSQGYNSVSEK